MLLDSIQLLATQLKAKNLMLATAESCTGGLLAASLTELPGASVWFDQALITYSNQAKQNLLQVSTDILHNHGAVSAPCALAMLEGLWCRTEATLGIAITGIAGPAGGSADKPVGSVYFAFGFRSAAVFDHYQVFSGSRQVIREQAVVYAVQQLIQLLRK